jgi:hypothetical protein
MPEAALTYVWQVPLMCFSSATPPVSSTGEARMLQRALPGRAVAAVAIEPDGAWWLVVDPSKEHAAEHVHQLLAEMDVAYRC